MAEKTGGESFFAKNIETLDKVFGTIETLEKSEIEVKKISYFQAEYWKYLAIGVFLIVLCELSIKTGIKEIW